MRAAPVVDRDGARATTALGVSRCVRLWIRTTSTAPTLRTHSGATKPVETGD
jgi:hypothetical protein